MAHPTRGVDFSGWLPGRILRAFAFVLFIAQLGLVAHQIEHYLIPDHMESGEESCVAFAPTTGAASLPVFIAPFVFIVFFTRFWTVTQAFLYPPSDRLGFRAHAPPV
jgi:hypothetical protein